MGNLKELNYKTHVEYIKKQADKFSYMKNIDKDELLSYLLNKYLNILNNFNENKGNSFTNYFKRSIKGYLFNFLRDVHLQDIPSSCKKQSVDIGSLEKQGYNQKYIENYLGVPWDLLQRNNSLILQSWENVGEVFLTYKSNKLSFDTLEKLAAYKESGLTADEICEKEKFNLELEEYC